MNQSICLYMLLNIFHLFLNLNIMKYFLEPGRFTPLLCAPFEG